MMIDYVNKFIYPEAAVLQSLAYKILLIRQPPISCLCCYCMMAQLYALHGYTLDALKNLSYILQ